LLYELLTQDNSDTLPAFHFTVRGILTVASALEFAPLLAFASVKA
jgi:hypothetical protein